MYGLNLIFIASYYATIYSMNDNVIDDLKQFITTAISQQTDELRKDVSDMRQDITGVRQVIKNIDNNLLDLSAHVAEALDTSSEAINEQIKDHDIRITKLETAKA